MFCLLYGDDEFTLSKDLLAMKQQVTPAELRDVNVATVAGRQATFEELSATCSTVPFLAEKRMVIVEGLLATFEPPPGQARPGRAPVPRPREQEVTLGRWEQLPVYLPQMPDTTQLVFVEGHLSNSNRLFAKIRALAEVRYFPLPKANELRQWIRTRAMQLGADLDPRAVDTLAETIGGNLRVIDSELQKLSTYCWGRKIRLEDVNEQVSYVREANIFATVDAALEGRPEVAIRATHQLLDSGKAPAYLIAMLARQVRLLLLAKDLAARRTPAAEMGPKLSLSEFALQKTLEQAGKFTTGQLAEAHGKLLEADLSVKTGTADEELALELLVADLASIKGGGR